MHTKEIEFAIGNSFDIIKKSNNMNIFNNIIIEFFAELSSNLMKQKQFPDLVAFAFFIRKNNILKIKEHYNLNKLSIGTCFHSCPSNIPLAFAISMFWGLIAGNINLIRLPKQKTPQAFILINIINTLLSNDKYSIIKDHLCMFWYNDNSISKYLSLNVDARILWGSNENIENFKIMKTSPRCIDITLPNRSSISVIDPSAFNEDNLKAIVEKFYNDTYLFDQNACSSPIQIFWLNDKNNLKDLFYKELEILVNSKYPISESMVLSKYTNLCTLAANNDLAFSSYNNYLYILKAKQGFIDTKNAELKFGMFIENNISNLNEIFSITSKETQSITYFNIDPQELFELIVKSNQRGIDRIVPIGKALDFSNIWDGRDIINTLSRTIEY